MAMCYTRLYIDLSCVIFGCFSLSLLFAQAATDSYTVHIFWIWLILLLSFDVSSNQCFGFSNNCFGIGISFCLLVCHLSAFSAV